jgi:hypothetical protein
MKISVQAAERFSVAPQVMPGGYVCTTPCVAEMPQGQYKLYLSPIAGGVHMSGDADSLTVAGGTQVYLRAPGHFRHPTQADMVPPAAVLVLSSIALTTGLIFAFQDGNPELQTVGVALSAGAVFGMIGGGYWAYNTGRGEIRPGATTTFSLK